MQYRASFSVRCALLQDHELIERPGKGWTPWKEGPVDLEIDRVWWAARVLHFAKLNVSCWFDGSDLVAIEHWGCRRPKWCMKNKPKDWQPLPEIYRKAREEEKQAQVDLFRARSNARALRATASRQETHGPHTVL
ncbi:hypothetical protein X773_01135 [Mesorhizobium sp. LSJC285A00]|nr:hypothetical protein X773_01135 [Mesorhizobium sp. LSJC285A00]